MSTSQKKASVIIVTYNYGRYIEQAIDSVLASDFPKNEIEIIVVDDGSNDDTQKIVAKYGNKIKYVYQRNLGKASATLKGIRKSSGKYIFNLDADDTFLPNKIKAVVEVYEKNPDIVHVASPAICWDTTRDRITIEQIPKKIVGRKIDGKKLLRYFYARGIQFGGGSTFTARRDVLENLVIPREIDMYIDEYLVISALNRGYSYFINTPLSTWRIHGENYSVSVVSINKSIRNLKSIKAISQNMDDSDMYIRKIYELKIRSQELYCKEIAGEKKASGIIGIWLFLAKSTPYFGVNILRVAIAYNLVKRSIPKFMIDWLRRKKRTIRR